jgi:hemolysin activation/secretion protein
LNFNGLGFESGFELFRQDSTINRQKLDLRISISSTGVWKFQVGYITSRSSGKFNLVGSEKVKIETNAISFSFLNTPFQAPGVILKKRAFQISLFPTLKKIQKERDTHSYPQLNWDLKWQYPISFNSQRFAIQTTTNISGIASKEITLQEQLRSGGNKSIRGFNENIFFLSQFAAFSIQPQYLIDRSLMIGLFGDFLVFNSKLNNKFFVKPSRALGFGVSIELDFGSNSVQLSIANGIVSGIPLDLQTTKIHFGYIARF